MRKEQYSLENLLRFLKSYPGVLFLKDANGCYCYTSDICAYVNGDLLGKNELAVQKDPKLGRQYYEEDQKLLKEGGTLRVYSEIPTESGSLYYEINRSAVQGEDGSIIGIIGTVADVTKEIELNKKIKKQFVTDVVTGVYNNRYLELWLKDETPVYPFTVIVGDCNFLKHINDMFGHECGDQLLRSTGDLFRENLPEKCAPVRVGGDEFLILCNDTDENEAEQLIRLLMEKADAKHIRNSRLSIAYGACTMRAGEMTFEECRNLADARMYTAKRKMKSQFLLQEGANDPVYNEEMLKNILRQMPTIIFFKDTECRYRYISAYNEKHLRDKEETNYGIGLTDLELQRDEARGREYYEDDLRILATGEGSILMTEMIIDGEKRYYQINKAAARNEEGSIIGVVGIVTDVTSVRSSSW
ncbi:MAG: diguanylate cyclase [Anaerovoracaceae bacterium]